MNARIMRRHCFYSAVLCAAVSAWPLPAVAATLCGSAAGKVLGVAPTAQRCVSGISGSTPTADATGWTWRCSQGTASEQCRATNGWAPPAKPSGDQAIDYTKDRFFAPGSPWNTRIAQMKWEKSYRDLPRLPTEGGFGVGNIFVEGGTSIYFATNDDPEVTVWVVPKIYTMRIDHFRDVDGEATAPGTWLLNPKRKAFQETLEDPNKRTDRPIAAPPPLIEAPQFILTYATTDPIIGRWFDGWPKGTPGIRNGDWAKLSDGTWGIANRAWPVRVRIPASAVPPPNVDGHMAIVQPDGRVFEMIAAFPITDWGGEFPIPEAQKDSVRLIGYACQFYNFTYPWGAGNGYNMGMRASYIPNYAGVLRTLHASAPPNGAEVIRPIPHALAVAVGPKMLKTAAVLPALAWDTQQTKVVVDPRTGVETVVPDPDEAPNYSDGPADLPMGSRLGIDLNDYNQFKIKLRTHVGKVIALTLVEYGAIVADRGGSDGEGIGITVLTEPEISRSAPKEWRESYLSKQPRVDYRSDMRLIRENLQVVTVRR